MEIKEYLNLCENKLEVEDYLNLEKSRMDGNSNNPISGNDWVKIIKGQSLKCFYCDTDLEIIQELIFNGIINPRKRGVGGYSGMHFELDHKNANKKDNSSINLAAACYYCNNDKSNTISSEIFKKHFGFHKRKAFIELFEINKFSMTETLRHHLAKKK